MIRDLHDDIILTTVRDRIVQELNPLKIILFGSRALGNHEPDSDIDVLVVLQEAPNTRAVAVGIRRLLSDLPVGKDVLVATPNDLEGHGAEPRSFFSQILHEGVTLFERV
jgi:predicted nucleotidyltransferase